MATSRPLLVYDGDCGFCRRWVLRWKAQTAGRVDFEPYQTAAARFSDVPRARFERAIFFSDGSARAWGAEAVFRALALAPRRRWLLSFYKALPPFAWASESWYRFVAGRRPVFSRLTALLWGADLEPPTYYGARWLFIKALALCYLAAFGAMAVQWPGLLGSNGLLPAADFLARARAQLGPSSFWALPSVFWWSAGDAALKAVCWSGTALSLLLLLGLAPGPILLALWALYLSIVNVGQDFLGFQWDILLLEAGFLAIFLAPWSLRPGLGRKSPPEAAFLWLLLWLLFRLMFESGCVKLTSGDPTWRSLTALYYHYQTQPLPTPLAWYAQQLPHAFQRLSCGLMFCIELGAPWLIFSPRRPRLLAFVSLLSLQVLIALTGNYCFFNLLAAALTLPLLDDSTLRRWLPGVLSRRLAVQPEPAASSWRLWAAVPVGVLAVGVGLLQLTEVFGARPELPAPARAVLEEVEAFHLVNGYGLFAVMTTQRNEISIEGSDDGRDWLEYRFRWKPEDLARRPRFVAPYQPRLDWQMWFAALGPYDQSPWFMNLIGRLLQGSPSVLALLANNPFPDHPPRMIRSLIYEYRFTTPAQRRATGDWWTRRLLGLYSPVVALPPSVRQAQPR